MRMNDFNIGDFNLNKKRHMKHVKFLFFLIQKKNCVTFHESDISDNFYAIFKKKSHNERQRILRCSVMNIFK